MAAGSGEQFWNQVQQFMSEPDHDNEIKVPRSPGRVLWRNRRAMLRTPVDIKVLPNAYIYAADLPGLKPPMAKVKVRDDNILKISGKRKIRNDINDSGVQYARIERPTRFMRKFPLPNDANTEGITATYNDGVLILTVPRKAIPEGGNIKTIDVPIVEAVQS